MTPGHILILVAGIFWAVVLLFCISNPPVAIRAVCGAMYSAIRGLLCGICHKSRYSDVGMIDSGEDSEEDIEEEGAIYF